MPQRKLLTKAGRKALPPLYAQDGQGLAAKAYVKLFAPWMSFTWYVTEFDGEDTLFGLVVTQQGAELGYFSLRELEEARGPFGLKIERDQHWSPRPLSSIESA